MATARTVARRRLAAGAALWVATAGMAGCSGSEEGTAQATESTTVATAAPTTVPASPGTVAKTFLAEWSAGNPQAAAALTDDPAAAGAALGELAGVPVTGTTLVPTIAGSEISRVRFKATLSLGDAGTVTYDSGLDLVRTDTGWKVKWSPAVIHPKLTATTKLHLGSGSVPVSNASVGVLDRNGALLDPGPYPSLANAIGTLRSGGPVVERPVPMLQLVDRAGGPPSDLQPVMPPAGAAPQGPTGRQTTIDARIQGVAEKLVAASPLRAAVAVVQPSTGHILAMAGNPPTGAQPATPVRPGSTFKVVVASALLRNGYSPGGPAGCPERAPVPGRPDVENAEKSETRPSATLQYSFAVSCNTTFVIEGTKFDRPVVPGEAQRYFGLGQQWDIGVGAHAYANIPTPGSPKGHAELMFGEHENLTASPLAMASVAATVQSGQFRQPIIVPDHGGRVTAAPLGGGVADGLRRMMRAVVTEGSGSSLRGVPGAVAAKTGTAQAPGGNVGWMIAYRGDVAIAVNISGISKQSYGNDTAGGIVAALLRSPEVPAG